MSAVQVKEQVKRETTNVQIDRIPAERHHHWKCTCCAGGGHCCCKNWYCYLLYFMMLGILACGFIPLHFLYTYSGGGGGNHVGYYDNETRLMKVSAFFGDRVEISVNSEDQFSANATLYLVQETPELVPGDYINETINVDRDKSDEYPPGVNYEAYYLNTNSTITLSACRPSDCNPFYLFIMKSGDFDKWKDSPRGANTGERNMLVTKECSKGYQQLNYTIVDNTFFYLVTYAPTLCSNDDDKRTATLVINRYEYSVNSVTVTDSCNTYRLPSCSLKVPLGAGYAKALVTVAGHGDGGYDITFSTSSRVWGYCVVVIPTLCLVLAPPIFCCICCCVRRRQRNSYNRLS